MYPNLKAELARNSLSFGEAAELLGNTCGTFSKKMAGKSKFSFSDVTKLRNTLCPDKPLEYLMETRDTTS